MGKRRITTAGNIYLRTFVLNLLIAACVFIPMAILGQGRFTMCEDWNTYVLAFRYLENQAVHSGNIFWNWNIDLGSSLIGDFTQFSLFLDPFNWLHLFLNQSTIMYTATLTMMLKFAVAGLNMSVYLKNSKYSDAVVALGSVLYAFCGFHVSYMLFDFFGDSCLFFPLVIWALDKLVQEHRHGLFAFWVFYVLALSVPTFWGILIFLIIYFLLRYFSFTKEGFRLLRQCLTEGVIGALMAGIVVVPSVANLLGIPKGHDKILGQNSLAYSSTDIMMLLKALLLPADSMSATSVIYKTDWWTTALYLPFIGVGLVIAYIIRYKDSIKTWLFKLTLFSTICVFIPVLNSAYYMGTAQSYHRWYYMVEFVMILCSCEMVTSVSNMKAIRIGYTVSLVLTCAFTLVVQWVPWYADRSRLSVFREKRYFSAVAIAVICVIINIIFAKEKDIVKYQKILLAFVSISAVITSGLVGIDYKMNSSNPASDDRSGRFTANSAQAVYNELVNTTEVFRENNIGEFPSRTYFWRGYYDYGLAGGIPSRNTFIGLLNTSIFRFYDALGTPRLTAFSPDGPTGIDELVGTRYYVLLQPDESKKLIKKYNNGTRDLYLYEDPDSLTLGYTYDTYMLRSEFETLPVEIRAEVMLNTLVIPDDKSASVSKLLAPDKTRYKGGVDINLVNSYKLAHHSEMATDFHKTRMGWECSIKTKKDKYAFFSVPYDKRWRATVNGESAEIVDINGLMAVKVDEGENNIMFTWYPRYLVVGAILSVLGFIICIVYSRWNRNMKEGRL